jgi:hypothetical protein
VGVGASLLHYITPKEKLSVKARRSYAKKNRCQAILCGFKTIKKIVKNPLQKGTQSIELKWTSLTALILDLKQRSTIVNFSP